MRYTVTVNDIAEMLGVTTQEFSPEFIQEFNKKDITYTILQDKEREQEILNQLKRIKNDTQIVGVPERTQVWENGWTENLQEFIQSGYDLQSLKPKFFRENTPCRFKRTFVMPNSPSFEYEIQKFLKKFIYTKYFSNVDNIYEFGCGTGYNLVNLAELFPDKKLFGLDFVPAVVKLLAEIQNHYHYNISGNLFDIRTPNRNFNILPNSAIFTFAALEQVSDQYVDFVKYLIEQKPCICVHIEPIAELYDEDNIVDWLAKEFHTKRHYLSGFLTYLQELCNQQKIELIKIKRLELGNWNHEGYSLIVWKPIV